jgi:hypothetical protein
MPAALWAFVPTSFPALKFSVLMAGFARGFSQSLTKLTLTQSDQLRLARKLQRQQAYAEVA